MKMKMLKNKSGITLVALIITIIILLILAGVSLSFVFNGGILDKAQSAVNEYENASQKEQNLLDQINKYIENELGDITNDEPVVPNVDENGLATDNTTIVAKDDSSIQIVIPKGFAPAILMTGTTQSLPGENGAVKEIMPAEEWSNITKADINSGIVVVDNVITYDGGQVTGIAPDFNEYVWIPMPDSSKFTRVAWNGPYYDIVGILQNGKHPLSDVLTEGKFCEEKTTQEYKEITHSMNVNKGFYISRYEASQKNSTTAQSKRNQTTWVNVSQLDAITASSNMNARINSHLIYGVEWDSILTWLLDSQATIGADTDGEDLQTITIDDIQSDSRSWGNYYNSIGEASTNAGGSAKPGGANEYWKVNNIYDLAGNVWEWTQEKSSTLESSAVRGGGFYSKGNVSPSASRSSDINSYMHDYIRIQGKFLCITLII